MKRLSDYENEEAIDLWADLLDPITNILSDPEVAKVARSGAQPLAIAKQIVHDHKKEASEILLRIDPTPVNGLNLIVRVLDVIMEIEESPEIMGFLGSSEENASPKSSTSAMASTKAKGN